MRWNYLIPLIVSVSILSGCTQATTITGETERIIKVEAHGIVLHYQNESFWSGDEMPRLLENKDEFSSKQIEKFINDLSRRGEGGEHAPNANVEFNEGRKSTILTCDIHGAVWEGGNSYHATFFWLLRPLELDFIDNDFEESEKGLFWDGSVNGVPTTVSVELPTIDSFVYEAWSHPIGHCHAHVW